MVYWWCGCSRDFRLLGPIQNSIATKLKHFISFFLKIKKDDELEEYIYQPNDNVVFVFLRREEFFFVISCYGNSVLYVKNFLTSYEHIII